MMKKKDNTTHKAPDRSDRNSLSVIELFKMFPDEESARKWFEGMLWKEHRYCGHCGSVNTKHVKSEKPMPYWCSDCRSYFSIRTGTPMQSSKISLQKWVIGLYLMTANLKGVSSMKLHRELGISQSCAWHMTHRIREAWNSDNKAWEHMYIKLNKTVDTVQNKTVDSVSNMYDKSATVMSAIGGRIRKNIDNVKDKTVNTVNKAVDKAGEYLKVKDIVQLLSNSQLLKLTEKILESAPTKFDKAMDIEYLRTRIGGGNHRLFDGGHTLSGAWEKAGVVCSIEKCTNSEKAIGILKSFTKELVTPKGMPFVTIQPDTYDSISNTLTKIPGVDRKYVYDLLSYDVLEIVGTSIGVVAILYQFSKQDFDMLSETLGSMGITTIMSANPLLGISVIASTAYAIKTDTLKTSSLVKGASIATLGFALGSMIAAPVLIELVVVITILGVANKHGTKDNIKNMKTLAKGYGNIFYEKTKEQLKDLYPSIIKGGWKINSKPQEVFIKAVDTSKVRSI